MPKYNLPDAWNAGYAIPEYVNAEPPARGTFTTQWLPRGTISEVLPPLLAEPEPLGSLSGSVLDGSVLAGPTLAGPTLHGDSLGLGARLAAQRRRRRAQAARRAGGLQGLGTSMVGDVLLSPLGLIALGAGAWFLLRRKR